jgi:Domain of unknown function (DU1801)
VRLIVADTSLIVAQIISSTPEHLRPIVELLHKTIINLHPDACLLAWPKQNIISFGIGSKKMSQHYAYIGIYSNHINLGFYRGALLNDSAHLLEGTGAKLRHLKLKSILQVQNKELIALILAAKNSLN